MFNSAYFILEHKSGVNEYNRWNAIRERIIAPKMRAMVPSLVFNCIFYWKILINTHFPQWGPFLGGHIKI